jgi:hypothetical protein
MLTSFYFFVYIEERIDVSQHARKLMEGTSQQQQQRDFPDHLTCCLLLLR